MMNKEEKEILKAARAGKLESVKPTRKQLSAYQRAAQRTLAKNKRVNIRISEQSLQKIQMRAMEEGIPYQTLMASILHKYISGRLVEAYQPTVRKLKRRI